MIYYRVQFNAEHYGYWEDFFPEPEDDDYMELLAEADGCSKQGVLPRNHPVAIRFIEILVQGDSCPSIFRTEDGKIVSVSIEERTTTKL